MIIEIITNSVLITINQIKFVRLKFFKSSTGIPAMSPTGIIVNKIIFVIPS